MTTSSPLLRLGRRQLPCITAAMFAWNGVAATFTPLEPLPRPALIRSATEYPGGSYAASNLLDGSARSEYSSAGAGTNTFVELEFAQAVRVGALRHVDRNDPATVSSSELTVMDSTGAVVKTLQVKHVNVRGGETLFVFPEPVVARRIRWQVTGLGPARHGTVGGAELSFLRAGDPEPTPGRIRVEARAIPFQERGQTPLQPINIIIHHSYAESVPATVRLGGGEPRKVSLSPGANKTEWKVPAVQSPRQLSVVVEAGGTNLSSSFVQHPVKPLTVYVLPHSHTDIGYTEIQTAIEDKQVKNLVDGMAAAKRTASYPEGARFVWHVEVLWAADLYLQRMNAAQREEFVQMVRNGQVALNGMYLNELTGLCRPEELVRLFRFATQLREQTGVPIDSAMISDVPGYTWGTVSAMAAAGIKYFSVAPNYFDRIGTILREWENKPFWWEGPDGKSRALVWIPYRGYALSHIVHKLSPPFVEDYVGHLLKTEYPFDIIYMRWAGHGDNAVPDPVICEFIRDWNAQYEWPRFIISSTSEAFGKFEHRYGDKLPVVKGDWTPYWEDGAGSSALETAMNRHSSDRLAQAETLFAMRQLSYPQDDFEDAWRNVLLYSEHTWGADVSISRPESQKTREQWEIKQSYALAADKQSRALLSQALAGKDEAGNAIDVFNTLSWERTDLVTLSPALSAAGERVLDERGRAVPSQRLTSGELVFVAEKIPPFSARRYTMAQGEPMMNRPVRVAGSTIENGLITVRVDEQTGGIVELRSHGHNFADTTGGEAINDYLYLPGDDLKDVKRSGPVKISVGENGPLVASLIVESEAPGCRKLRREMRVIAGRDHVEVLNLVDKERLQARSYHAREGKESVNFAFPFNVPDGQVLIDIPFAVVRPEHDQMPSACKDWFTVGRWVEVANKRNGITLVTLDAPLLQVGGLTARLLNSQTNPDVWRQKVEKTQKVYSWAMNNHWGTNYRAYQEGPTLFRFILRPHDNVSSGENTRFATGFSQPLVAARGHGAKPSSEPLLKLSGEDVLVTGLKPSDDGRAVIVRLFGAGDDTSTKLEWSLPIKSLHVSDTSEQALSPVRGRVKVPSQGLVTLRAELK